MPQGGPRGALIQTPWRSLRQRAQPDRGGCRSGDGGRVAPRLAGRNWTKIFGHPKTGSPALRGGPPKSPIGSCRKGSPFKRRRARAVKNARDRMPQAPHGRQELSVELGGMSLAPFGTASPSAYSGSGGALGDHRGPRHPGWVSIFAERAFSSGRSRMRLSEEGHYPQALLKAYPRLTDEMLEFGKL